MLMHRSSSSEINNFTIADKFNECHVLDKSIMKLIWQSMLRAKGKQKQQKETTQGAAQRKEWWSEWMQLSSGGRWAVSSFCPAQPVDFRQDKTETVYSECPERSISSESSGDSGSENSDYFQGFYSPLFVLMSVFPPPLCVHYCITLQPCFTFSTSKSSLTRSRDSHFPFA